MRNGLLPTGSSIYLSYSILLPVLSYFQYPSCWLHQVKCDKNILGLWRMVSFRLPERWNWPLILFHTLNCPSWMETDWLRLCGGVWWALQYPAVWHGIVLYCMVLCAGALGFSCYLRLSGLLYPLFLYSRVTTVCISQSFEANWRYTW